MLTSSNKRIISLEKELNVTEVAFEKAMKEINQLLRERKTLKVKFKSYSAKLVNVEAELDGLKGDIEDDSMNVLLSRDRGNKISMKQVHYMYYKLEIGELDCFSLFSKFIQGVHIVVVQ